MNVVMNMFLAKVERGFCEGTKREKGIVTKF